MKQTKVVISLIMALMMIASTFVVVAGNINITGGPNPGLTVEKTVWNGEFWVDEIYADLGDTVRFKINITYYKVNQTSGYRAIELVVNDTLPPCLDYANDAVITHGTNIYYGESLIDGKTIWWYLYDDYDIELHDDNDPPRTVTIEFNATVVDYGVNVNHVKVTGTEKCSNEPLYGEDDATVIVEEPPCDEGIEVEKKVKVDGEWVDFIGDLILGDVVTFKINVTYNDCDPFETIVCLEVTDYLPCCLDFLGGVSYEGSTFTVPAIDPVVDGKIITWNWTGTNTIQMNDGDVLVITFDTNVTSYCQEQDFNLVEVDAWTCCDNFHGEDSVEVDCTAPETTFVKKVKVDGEWEDAIETYLGNTIRFKLRVEYYGIENLTEIQIVDHLPCILEYGNIATGIASGGDVELEEFGMSTDGKWLYWNFTGNLSDGGFIEIQFDALVTGTTGNPCSECNPQCKCINEAWVNGSIGCVNFEMDDYVDIVAYHNCPPSIPQLDGDTSGQEGDELSFDVWTTDSDEDQVYYQFNWGDSISGWLGPYAEGVEKTFTHIWDTAGTYEVRVRAEDEHGATSEWSYPLEVLIEEEEPTEEGLSICVTVFNIGRVSATLKNIGEEDINDIVWNITVGRSGIIRNKVYAENNGT